MFGWRSERFTRLLDLAKFLEHDQLSCWCGSYEGRRFLNADPCGTCRHLPAEVSLVEPSDLCWTSSGRTWALQREVRGSLTGAFLDRKPQLEIYMNSAVSPQEFLEKQRESDKSLASVLKRRTLQKPTRACSHLSETNVEERATHERKPCPA